MSGEIVVTGKQLVYLYGAAHFLYAFGTHYAWVWKVRQKVKTYMRNLSQTKTTLSGDQGQVCGRCMVNQLVPKLLLGLEWKILQVIAFGFSWLAKVLLGGSTSAPFKIKPFKDPGTSFYPVCKHGRV